MPGGGQGEGNHKIQVNASYRIYYLTNLLSFGLFTSSHYHFFFYDTFVRHAIAKAF